MPITLKKFFTPILVICFLINAGVKTIARPNLMETGPLMAATGAARATRRSLRSIATT